MTWIEHKIQMDWTGEKKWSDNEMYETFGHLEKFTKWNFTLNMLSDPQKKISRLSSNAQIFEI